MTEPKTKKRIILHISAVLLIFCTLAAFCSCSEESDKKKLKIDSRLNAAIVSDAPFSADFVKSANPLLAENDLEYAVGCLTASTIMRRQEDGSWQPVLGEIEVSESGGRTTATVTLNDNAVTYGGAKVRIEVYTSLMQQLTAITCRGYYRNFYKNPIEGLAAFRYKNKDLKIEDVPDFEAQAREAMKAESASQYKKLLIETRIAGLFGENLQMRSYDGRTFMETLMQIDGHKHQESEYNDQMKKESDVLLEKLASYYAGLDKSVWIKEMLVNYKLDELESAYKTEQTKIAGGVGSIRGVSKSGDKKCTVIFTKAVPKDEAISILNLPLLTYSGDQRCASRKFTASGSGVNGKIISLIDKKNEAFSVCTLSQEEAVPSLIMGQISLAVFDAEPSKELRKQAEDAGFSFAAIGRRYAIYNPKAFDSETLGGLALFY